MQLTDDDKAVLDFERSWWKHPGAKEAAIRETFDVSATRDFQMLNTIISNDAALEHDPLLVLRLRRLRDARSHQRSALRLVERDA